MTQRDDTTLEDRDFIEREADRLLRSIQKIVADDNAPESKDHGEAIRAGKRRAKESREAAAAAHQADADVVAWRLQ